MQETVVCWCCEYFVLLEKMENHDGVFVDGICRYTDLFCHSDNKVCRRFLLKSGLYTKKIIPDICENYNGTPCDGENLQ